MENQYLKLYFKEKEKLILNGSLVVVRDHNYWVVELKEKYYKTVILNEYKSISPYKQDKQYYVILMNSLFYTKIACPVYYKGSTPLYCYRIKHLKPFKNYNSLMKEGN